MSTLGANYRLFLQEFRRTFETTGAIMPSGRALCRALAKHVGPPAPVTAPRRILEVGPGTGVATTEIIKRLGPADTLDLVELNERFATLLNERRATDPLWMPAAGRVTVHHLPIQELPADSRYEGIVSGLPLNNFPVTLVGEIFAKLRDLAAPGATLSFFEYAGIRRLKALVSRRDDRRRLAGVEEQIAAARRQWGIGSDLVLANVPPAWAHHLRF